MKIIDGLKLKGRPAEIPDSIREDLPQFFLDMGFHVGAEIGTSKGLFAESFGKVGLKLYCIDPYLDYPDFYHGEDFKTVVDSQYEEAKKRLAPYDCTIIKKTSMEALKDIADESLDFVYIDGNHGFKFVTEDIYEWSKKVKKGGVISGHDYVFVPDTRKYDKIHTRYVIDAYTRAFDIKPWYVIGSYKSLKGEKRDKYRSWFWIK